MEKKLLYLSITWAKFEMFLAGEQKGKDSLVTQEFLIDATAFESKPPPASAKERRKYKRKYPGRGKPNYRTKAFDHHINEGAFFKHHGAPFILDNDDNWCLFRAYEICRQKYTLNAQQFSRYLDNEQKQIEDVQSLLQWTGIPDDLDHYDVTECGQLIQNYYDAKFLGRFKLLAFEFSGTFSPFWRSKPAGDYEHILSVLYSEEMLHYNPLNKVGKLFSKSHIYCFAVSLKS